MGAVTGAVRMFDVLGGCRCRGTQSCQHLLPAKAPKHLGRAQLQESSKPYQHGFEAFLCVFFWQGCRYSPTMGSTAQSNDRKCHNAHRNLDDV